MSIAVEQPKRLPSKIKPEIATRTGLVPLEYKAHQIDGIRKLAKMKSFLLGDEMGLGKSVQAITVAALDFDAGSATKILVLCPPKLTVNWAEEIEKFSTFNAVVFPKGDAKRTTLLEDADFDILIMGYTMVAKWLPYLNDIGFDICICDEAHELKSTKSVRWKKGVKKLKAGRWFMVTGTAMLNRPNELWTLLHKIDPDSFKNSHFFNQRFCAYGGFGGKQIVGARNVEELAGLLKTVMVRRLKKDVLDLPPKEYITKTVGLSPQQRKLYDEAIDTLQLIMPGDPTPMELESGMTRAMRLKQICSTPASIKGENGESFPDDSEKLDLVVSDLVELVDNGHKAIVFTQFRGTMAALSRRLDEANGIANYQLNGDVKVEERQRRIAEWTEAEEPGVILAMIQVAGVGLTMTAADHALFVDKSYVPGINEQAEDRIHRIGASETENVTIIDYLCRGTVEDRVEQILAEKRKMFDDIVNGKALEPDEIAELENEMFGKTEIKRAVYAAVKDKP